MQEVQRDHKHAKPKAMLSKSTFLFFDSSLSRTYYNILSALDCLPLLGCNHQLSQNQSHFKTCMRYSCPHAITDIYTGFHMPCTKHRDTWKVHSGRDTRSAPHAHVHRYHIWQREDHLWDHMFLPVIPMHSTVRSFLLPPLELLQCNTERAVSVPWGCTLQLMGQNNTAACSASAPGLKS